ncbi:hypothetical protein BJX62DRAFT_155844 [Aspergillus germanicus]
MTIRSLLHSQAPIFPRYPSQRLREETEKNLKLMQRGASVLAGWGNTRWPVSKSTSVGFGTLIRSTSILFAVLLSCMYRYPRLYLGSIYSSTYY